MPQTTLFRTLILASVVLAIVGALVDPIFPSLLPAVLREARDAELNGPPHNLQAITIGLLLVAFIVGAIVWTIALYRYKPWGRRYSLWLTALSIVGLPFMGPTLNSGLTSAFFMASSEAWAAALAMAYFSEVRHRFEPPQETSP